MKALSDKQQAAAQEQVLKLLCFNCLPMLLALILLGWLSFGLPHPTWLLLLKTIVQSDTLIAQQGMSFLLPLLILAIQSIFLICAWGLLIWGITREVKTLIAFYSDIATQQTVRPSVAAAAAAAAAAAPVVPQTAAAAPPVVPNPYPSSYAPQFYAPPPPIPANPFATDDEEDFPTELIDLPTQLTTPPDLDTPAASQSASSTRYASYDLLVGAAAQHEDESDYPQIEGPAHDERDAGPPRKRSTSIQRRTPISSYESDQDDDISWRRPADQEIPAYTPPPAPAEDPLEATVISDRSKMNKARQTEESKQALPAASPKRRPKQPEPQQHDPFSVVEDDPFAVQEDVLHVFEREDPEEQMLAEEEQAPEEQMLAEEEQAPEDDPVFVYGNPFDGPLPDVFIHDEDLKRSIEEQNITISEDGTAHGPAKKTNQKPTGIRKRS